MSAYAVACYSIKNPEGYEKYVPAVIHTLAPHGGEVLVADYDADVFEGEAHDVTVVLRFPDKAAIKRWYESEEYQAGIHHRTDNTEGFFVSVNEFTPPT